MENKDLRGAFIGLNARLKAGVKELREKSEKMRLDALCVKVSVKEKAEHFAIVAGRISAFLNTPFDCSPDYYIKIHKTLFDGREDFAGRFRKHRFELSTISPNDLPGELENIMAAERQYISERPETAELIPHIAKLHAFLWGTHFFPGGNTRTSKVFIIGYLRAMGYKVNVSYFMDNHRYLKDALYSAVIDGEEKYILRFYRNVLNGENNKLSFEE